MTGLIHRTIDFSVRHKIMVFVTVAICCVLGYWCMSTMRLDAIPDLGDTQGSLSTLAGSAVRRLSKPRSHTQS